MKKILVLLMCMVMILSVFAGCTKKVGGKNEVATEETTKETAQKNEDNTDKTTEAEVTETVAMEPGYYNLADFEAQTGTTMEFSQAPDLDKAGLPPVEERLPENPLVQQTFGDVGMYGGIMRTSSINVEQDWHLRHLNSANLIEMPASSGWDAVSSVFGVPRQPGIFEEFGMNEDGTVFSGTIRKGLKWSDGTPVTTEDVRFRIEDIFMNEELYPAPPNFMTWGNKETIFTVVDEYTFTFTFGEPYGGFIEREIGSWPATYNRMLVPAHYMKQFHLDYGDEEKIFENMQADEFTNMDEWPAYFNDKVGIFGCDYVGLDNDTIFPVLDPWVCVEDLGNGNFRYERNPYFYMVDQEGNQLPYIDEVKRTYVTDAEMLNMAIIAGDVDVSCMTISIEDYPLYKEHEAEGGYAALPLSAWQDQIEIFAFNMYHADEALRPVYGDVRFRRAMSLALDRKTMNETMFLGLGRPAQVAPRPASAFYEEGMEESYAEYDLDGAKALLDEMGMIDVDGDGWRERPDGEPFEMMYEYFVITQASITGSEFAKRYWEEIGVKVEVKQVDVGYWWGSLQPTNEQEATCWWLGGSGANMTTPWFLVPSMITPEWYDYTTLKDTATEEEWAEILAKTPEWQQEMQDLRLELLAATKEEDRVRLGTRIWQLQAEYLPCIGVATDTKTPMIVNDGFGNVMIAEENNYNYITTMEHAEQFYFTSEEDRAK